MLMTKVMDRKIAALASRCVATRLAVEGMVSTAVGVGRTKLKWTAAALLGAALSIGQAHAQSALPDPGMTPGAINPEVTAQTIDQTICKPRWTKNIRPPTHYTSALKRKQLQALGYTDQDVGHYEEDHLIPLEIGGDPHDPRNLWPEPRFGVNGWTANRKDALERKLNRLVCSHRLSLADAQQAMATDWVSAYGRFVP